MTAFLGRMREATRLTRAGRLSEATAFLQRMLNGNDASTEADAGPVIDGTVEPVEQAATSVFLSGRFANEAGARPYKLFVPADGSAASPRPLIVMLHGCTQSPDDFAAGTRMNTLAERHGCLVLYPAQTGAANAQRCWNWFNEADQHRDAGEPAIIAGMTCAVMAEHAVDPARVYVAGLSAGGAAAAILAETYPDLFAAVGIHSGLATGSAHGVSSAFSAMSRGHAGRPLVADSLRMVPAIVFHGTRDTTVNPLNADAIVAQARAAAALEASTEAGTKGGRSYVRTLFADTQGRAVIEQWNVEGLGHAWSGGGAEGSFADPLGPDASAEMLRFFFDHPMAD